MICRSALALLVCLACAGCGSSAPEPSVSVQNRPPSVTNNRVIHEAEFARNPQLRARIPGQTLMTYLENSGSSFLDTGDIGLDRLPFILKERTRLRINLNAPHVGQVRILDPDGRGLAVLEQGLAEIELAPGPYQLEISSKMQGEANVFWQPGQGVLAQENLTDSSTPVYVSEISESLSMIPVTYPTAFVGVGSQTSVAPMAVNSEAAFAQQFPGAGPALVLAIHQYFLNGGRLALVATSGSLNAPDVLTALQGFGPRTYSKLILTDFHQMPAASAELVAPGALSLAARQPALLFLDLPDSLQNAQEAVLWRQQHPQLNSSNCALYWPSLIVTGANGSPQACGASASVVGLLDRVGLQPTGPSGSLQNVLSLTQPYSQTDLSNLTGAQINAIGTALNPPPAVPTTVTSQMPTIAAVLIANAIQQSVVEYLNEFVFSPNGPTTWANLTAGIGNFLQLLWTNGLLVGATPSQAYSVKCGLGITMTGQDILNGYLTLSVTVQLGPGATPLEITFMQTMGN